ncbi:MAG: folate-binding protein [Proteobacteria bacterium]|nr:folate-binding protein [Pseudomonadota bacterium]
MSETSLDPAPCLIPLPARALVAVSGEEAAHFLHSVLTANIEKLPAGEATLAALLTPQGKIIADMLVANASDDEKLYFLDVNRGFAEDVARRLAVYRLRAKVEIAVLDASVAVYAVLGGALAASERFYAFADPRSRALGQRLYGPAASVEAETADLRRQDEAFFAAQRITHGIPECGPDYLPLASYPHEANMDQLGGVDFKKGCYVGQEIVSRMEHRATARTRTLLARFNNGFGVDSGAEVRAGEQLLGSLGVSAGACALAQVRVDRWLEALEKNTEITGGGVPVLLEKPGYARF